VPADPNPTVDPLAPSANCCLCGRPYGTVGPGCSCPDMPTSYVLSLPAGEFGAAGPCATDDCCNFFNGPVTIPFDHCTDAETIYALRFIGCAEDDGTLDHVDVVLSVQHNTSGLITEAVLIITDNHGVSLPHGFTRVDVRSDPIDPPVCNPPPTFIFTWPAVWDTGGSEGRCFNNCIRADLNLNHPTVVAHP
jgi:hypothetical protein